MSRLVPCPITSRRMSPAFAQATASATSAASRGVSVSMSEARDVRERQFSAAHVHAPQLGAAVQRRKDLAGIEELLRVEGAFDAFLLRQIDLVEHGRHEVALLDADTVLAREHAADLDAEPEDVGAESLGPLQFP